jgi:PAS domain S-box-containing protein
MNPFFRRLPLSIKLILIGILPLIFLVYLSVQLYKEKTQKVKLLSHYIELIHQSGDITTLIDNLQLERRYSYEYAFKKEVGKEMLAQRIQTDSSIIRLKKSSDLGLLRFPAYTYLNELQSSRAAIDSNTMNSRAVMHYYTTAIFRMNTLNTTPAGSSTYLQPVYNDIVAQKLLSEMITYLGILHSNIYNALYTKEYMVEIASAILGVHQTYNSYETEFLIKASPASAQLYKDLRNQPTSFNITVEYLAKLFKTFSYDSVYNAQEWRQVSDNGVDELQVLQQKIWKRVDGQMNAIFKKEQAERDTMLVLLIVALVIVIGFIAYTIYSITRMLTELKRGALRIARGATDVKFKVFSNDAVGSLARSISKIDENNKQLANAATAIGKGDFDVPLQPRSNEDILGNALVQMKDNLQLFTRQMEESKEQFRQLADFMPQMVWTADPNGFLDYYNKQWYEYTGFQEGYGDHSWTPILHPDDAQHCIDAWYHSVNTGNPYEIEYRFKDRVNGDYRWFLGRALPVRNTEGQIVKWFGTCTDIHEGKTISEKLEMLVRERTEELERSNDDLQQFAHVASHDLKEPLRKIRVFANLLQEEFTTALPEKAMLYLNKMQSAAVRMASMVDGVLNYSITNTSDQQFETVNLNEIIKEIEEDLEVIIQQKGAEFFYEKLPHIKGIRVLFYQLFYNLINNALKFSKENEKNHITITSKEISKFKLSPNLSTQSAIHYISIEVKDTGIGFDEVYSEKMFQIFSRLNAKDQYEGTGLGLALCRKIVSRHHGVISAKGKLNEGATFTIVLPVD